ncbi:MAG: hypothetical protein RI957_72 [Verrucomicrobiota bacterium]
MIDPIAMRFNTAGIWNQGKARTSKSKVELAFNTAGIWNQGKAADEKPWRQG